VRCIVKKVEFKQDEAIAKFETSINQIKEIAEVYLYHINEPVTVYITLPEGHKIEFEASFPTSSTAVTGKGEIATWKIHIPRSYVMEAIKLAAVATYGEEIEFEIADIASRTGEQLTE